MSGTQVRRIGHLGKFSLGIGLPLDWVRYFDLRAGDELEILVGEDLIVRPRQRAIGQKTVGELLRKGLGHDGA